MTQRERSVLCVPRSNWRMIEKAAIRGIFHAHTEVRAPRTKSGLTHQQYWIFGHCPCFPFFFLFRTQNTDAFSSFYPLVLLYLKSRWSFSQRAVARCAQLT